MTQSWVADKADPLIRHLDGVWWDDTPKPRRWHRCRPQTRGLINGTWFERCSCGGLRMDLCGPWMERNRRRRTGRRHA